MIDRALDILNNAALWVGGLAILAITLLGGLDIISTFAFGQPIHTTYEATQTLMVLAVFLGLGMVYQNRGHISADIGYRALPPIGRRAADFLTLLLITGYFGALAWRGWQGAIRSWSIGEYSAGLVAFPVYPAKIALAVGATIAVMCCLADLLRGRRYYRE